MLLKHRREGVESTSLARRPGFEHLEHKALAVIRWLGGHKIDYVLVGPVAHAVRGDRVARGTVAIVPAPYGRNYERLARALNAEHATLRSDRGPVDRADSVPVKLSGEKLARGRRWPVRFGDYDLDVEVAAVRSGSSAASGDGSPAGGSGGAGGSDADGAAEGGGSAGGVRYQELLYEANRFELADGVSVEVASLEDLEHFSHVRRTGSVPEFRVMRAGSDEAPEVDAAEGVRAPADEGAPHRAPADGSET